MSVRSLACADGDPIAFAADRGTHTDRQLEIAAGDLQLVTFALERNPDIAGCELVREATAREAVERASSRGSRSRRNFTSTRFQL